MSAGLQVWNGTAYQTPPNNLKVWNGSAMTQPVSCKAWNGSAYVQVWPSVVQYDATGAGAGAYTSSLSWSHTTGPSANYLAAGSWYNGLVSVSRMTVGSTNLYDQAYSPNNGWQLNVGVAAVEPNTTYTVTVALSGPAYIAGNSVSYSGVGSSPNTWPEADAESPSLTSGTIPAGSLLFGVFGTTGNYPTGSIGTGTWRWSQGYSAGNNYPVMIGDNSSGTATSTTLQASTGIYTWGGLGVILEPQ